MCALPRILKCSLARRTTDQWTGMPSSQWMYLMHLVVDLVMGNIF